MSYFAVHIPNAEDSSKNDDDQINIFTDKKKALSMLKNYKEARLKVFATNEDAVHFSQHGLEVSISNTLSLASLPTPTIPPLNKAPFRGPKSQELVAFRKCIEQAKYDEVKARIWSNPRYLVGSGDTPTILKESFRYNALHVAALSKNAKITELILQTVGDPCFIQTLQGKTDTKTCEEVSAILLDLYLNMPEKGRSETPLHLAAKFGAIDVVEVLTSYPQCTMTPNSYGQLPKYIICSRVDNPLPSVINQIYCLLEERFYVPVIRSVDNSTPPIVGEPFSPLKPPNLALDLLSPEMEIQAYAGPMSKEQATTFRRQWKTPPRIQNELTNYSSPKRQLLIATSSCSPTRKMCIYPLIPVSINQTNTSTDKIIEKKTQQPRQLLFDDEQQFMKKTTQTEGEKCNVWVNNMTTSTELLSTYNYPKNSKKTSTTFNDINNWNNSDLRSSDEGKQRLVFDFPQLLGHNIVHQSPLYKERHLRLVDAEKGLEYFGRQLAEDHHVAWKEYWHFLGCFTDIRTVDGLNKVEVYLQEMEQKIQQKLDCPIKNPTINNNNSIGFMNVCNAFERLELRDNINYHYQTIDNQLVKNVKGSFKTFRNDDELSPILSNGSSPSLSCASYLCVEKSCQVYARRVTKTLIQQSHSIISIRDMLNAELKRLKSLINSYKEDQRFINVNFQWTHSRFANLIVVNLRDEINSPLNQITDILTQIQETTEKSLVINAGITNSTEVVTANKEMLCLLHFLLNHLVSSSCDPLINKIDDYDTIPTTQQILTTEKQCANLWSYEKACTCSWTTEITNRHNRSIKRNYKKLHFINEQEQKQQQQQSMSNYSERSNISEWRNDLLYDSDEEFLSDSGSENDVYFTPPESPSATNNDINSSDDSDDAFEDCNCTVLFKNYILGEEPTKTDVDVLNALQCIPIDQEIFPHIYAWKMALMQHTIEERNNFPSPSVVVKKSNITTSAANKNRSSNYYRQLNGEQKDVSVKRLLFSSPVKKIPAFTTPVTTPTINCIPSKFDRQQFVGVNDNRSNNVDSDHRTLAIFHEPILSSGSQVLSIN